jgi:hypothetical protein
MDEVAGGDDYLAEEHRVRGAMSPTDNSTIANNNSQPTGNEE